MPFLLHWYIQTPYLSEDEKDDTDIRGDVDGCSDDNGDVFVNTASGHSWIVYLASWNALKDRYKGIGKVEKKVEPNDCEDKVPIASSFCRHKKAMDLEENR